MTIPELRSRARQAAVDGCPELASFLTEIADDRETMIARLEAIAVELGDDE